MADLIPVVRIAQLEFGFTDDEGYMPILAKSSFSEINEEQAEQIIYHLKKQFGL